MKPTKQIIEEMDRFEKKWCKDIDSGFISPFCHIDDIRELVFSLLSAFAEEVIGKEEEILTAHELMTKNKSMNKSIADWEEGKQMGKSVLRAEQRLKAKEIISSIGK